MNEEDKGGCPYKYKWCYTTPLLPLPQFFVAATVVGSGYPVGAVVHNILYSKLIGSLSQVWIFNKWVKLHKAHGNAGLYLVNILTHMNCIGESPHKKWSFPFKTYLGNLN